MSFADAAFGGLRWREAAAYLPAQVAGCVAGAVLANLMFAQAAVSVSAKHRATPAHFLSEVIATLGLILVVFALARSGSSRSASAAVGAYIGAAYSHVLDQLRQPGDHDRPDVLRHLRGDRSLVRPAFIVAQVIGGALAVAVIRVLYPRLTPQQAADIVFPHRPARPDGQDRAPPRRRPASWPAAARPRPAPLAAHP